AWTLVERSRRHLARRVDGLARAMRQTARSGDVADLPASGTQDELDYVAQTAREMAGGLMQRADAHRAFSEQLAHELRTPLARLSSSLPDEGADEATDAVRRRILDVSRALGDMLDLAAIRNDAIQTRSGFAPSDLPRADLAQLVGEVAEIFEDVAEEAGVSLEVEAVDGERPLDPALFRRMAVNLIDNALHHAEPGRRVRIAANLSDGTVLRVSNAGQFPDALLDGGPERFETFGGEGTGLGLAFADAIADYHGWTLRLRNENGRAVAVVAET
ncbi:MAG: HAMP domain-containing sensor histidine kinase, partial [Litorimonas sp.]